MIRGDINIAVENGVYFETARQWYYGRYIYIYIQRLQATIIMIFTILSFFIVVNAINIDNIDTKTVVLYNDNIAYHDDYKLSHLIQPNMSSQLLVVQYLAKFYLNIRESYSPILYFNLDALNAKIEQVRTMSSSKEGALYENSINPIKNKASPLNIYSTKSTIIIRPTKVKIRVIEGKYKLDIDYVRYISSQNGVSKESKSVHMLLVCSDIKAVHNNKIPMNFSVISYKVD